MLRYIYGDELHIFPKLRDTMFRDRAAQFSTRLAWQVDVDANGHERDDYDELNPLYVIWQCANGRHGGSMRFLPTVARTMVYDHFTHLSGADIRHPLIWECTRFCLAENAEPKISAALMLGGMEVGLAFHLTDAVGVFDARMTRVYRRLGWSPTILGTSGSGRDAVSVGLWAYDTRVRPQLLRQAGVSQALSRLWLERAFGPVTSLVALAG